MGFNYFIKKFIVKKHRNEHNYKMIFIYLQHNNNKKEKMN